MSDSSTNDTPAKKPKAARFTIIELFVVLQVNLPERGLLRQALIDEGVFPPKS